MSLIKSPINGILDQINIREGELAMPGQLMMKVVNLKNFYLNAEVSESYLPYLHKGDQAEIKLMSYNTPPITAPIYRISNIINKENRSFTVQIKVENIDGIIKPNMLAMARFKDFESEAALVVPSILVKKDFHGDYLFIAQQKNGKAFAHKVYVKTGKSINDVTMIQSGLQAGDKIIINGYNQVVEGSLLSIK
jgi:RND family efflux transporter MFP subunit